MQEGSGASHLILYSISNPNLQDSLALVDLYNSTNGPAWINHRNWLTTAPLSTWHGVTVRRGKVIFLALEQNNLTGILPSSLGNLSNLEEINFFSNQITGNIPASLGSLSNLNTLSFGYNKLSGSIPVSLGNLSSLKYLYLFGNQLTGNLPSSLGNLSKLEEIHLGENQLTGDMSSLFSLTNLKQINLAYNQLTGDISPLFSLINLEVIHLENDQFTGIIPESIMNLTKLWYFNVANNQLSGKISDSVGTLPQLSQIDLRGNHLNGPIPSSLSKLYINYFHIEDNQFRFEGMENLPATHGFPIVYSPQAPIPLNRNGNLFSVSAGGTLANDTFRLYKDDVLNETKTGDSTFTITAPGKYYVTVTNSIATLLTLSSNVSTIAGLVIADSTVNFIQNFSGTNPITVGDSALHKLIATITPAAGVNGLSGDVDCSVFVDTAVSNFNNQPYVQRHYDITPATNPASSLATVMLYFTQQEFDNFNSFPGHGLDLPTGPADAAGKANLRVYQFHGFSTTSLPGSYSGTGVEINPADANIVWNAASQFWEVSFDVTGFSGFFVSSLNSAILPVKLLSFTGNVQGKNALLKWVTATEINAAYFELQRSNNGNNFNTITKINAAGNNNNDISYQYADLLGAEPVYFYRLKMVDKDGVFTYSNVIKLSSEANSIFTIYPNPSKDFVFVRFPVNTNDAKLKIIDMGGRAVKTVVVLKVTSQIKLPLKNLPNGSYKIVYFNGEKEISKTLLIE